MVFDYAILDSLDQMGVEILGLPNPISQFLKFEAPKYINVGTLFEPNFRLIYELEPMSSSSQADRRPCIRNLPRSHLLYLAIDTNDYLVLSRRTSPFSEIFGEEFVKAEVAKVRSSIEEVSRRLGKRRQRPDPHGKRRLPQRLRSGSRFDIIHSEFGFKPADPNIQVANHGQNISFEYLLKINPEYILVIDRGATVGGSISAQQVMDNVLVRSTDAYKKNRIIYLTSQVWYVASGGLEGTKTMIEDIEKAIEN